MSKSERQTARKPAIKHPKLRKKMIKAKVYAKQLKKK